MSNRMLPTIYVVDDDQKVRESLQFLLQNRGFSVVSCASGAEFWTKFKPETPACVMLDVRMPGEAGPEIQARLAELKFPPPVLFLTAHGDVNTAVKAMKLGASEFLEKPVDSQELIVHLTRAWEQHRAVRQRQSATGELMDRLRSLSRRERQVLLHVVRGKSNKAIGDSIGISFRTVENHRSRLLHKTGAESVLELMTTLLDHGIDTVELERLCGDSGAPVD